jgi:ABC-2 type transport system permease protein
VSARLVLHQLRFEQLSFWRTREAAFFIFAFPILLLLLLGSVYDGEIEGHAAADWLLVGMLGYGAANTAFGGLAITLVLRREYAQLKRIRGTPLPAAVYLACVVLSSLLVFALQSIVLYAIGVTLFDAEVPDRPVSLLLALLLGAAGFTGLGLALAGLIRSAEGVSPVVNFIVLPMSFISGSFGPTSRYPDFIEDLANLLPLHHLIELLAAVALDSESIVNHWGAMAVVAAWGAVGYGMAARYFGWEPRHGIN